MLISIFRILYLATSLVEIIILEIAFTRDHRRINPLKKRVLKRLVRVDELLPTLQATNDKVVETVGQHALLILN